MSRPEYVEAIRALEKLTTKELMSIGVPLHRLRWEKQNGMPFPTFDKVKFQGGKDE